MPDDDHMLGQNLVDVRNEARRNANSGETLFTLPPRLTERQQYVYALTEQQTVTAAQAGRELHRRQRCPYCTPERECQFAESNGREVLEALKRKGLLKRDRHHIYRRTDSTTDTQNDTASTEIPY